MSAVLATAPLAEASATGADGAASGDEPGILTPALRDEIHGIWGRHRMLIVGETHGTNESPLVVSELLHIAARSTRVVIGLEFPREDCGHIAEYMRVATSPLDTSVASAGKFWHRKNQDGRSSSAMLRLITEVKKSRDLGMPIDLECFDSYASQPGISNDEAMAQAIERILAEQRYAGAKFLFLTGNYHGRYSSGDSPQSMATLLRGSDPFTLLIRSVNPGTSWNCVDQVCASHDFAPQRYLDVPTPSLLLHGDPERTGFDGTLIIGQFSASPPLP